MEQRELSLELSLPLLLPPSDLELELALQVCWVSLTMVSSLEKGNRRSTVGKRQGIDLSKKQLWLGWAADDEKEPVPRPDINHHQAVPCASPHSKL